MKKLKCLKPHIVLGYFLISNLRIVVSIACILIAFHSGNTQNSVQETRLESLINDLKSHPEEDEKKLFLLNRISSIYIDINHDLGLETVELAINLATQLNNLKALSLAYSIQADLYEGKRDYVRSLKYYQKAYELYTKLDDKHGIAHQYLKMGTTYSHKINNTKTLEKYYKALELFKTLDDSLGIAMSFYSLCKGHFLNLEQHTSIDYCQKSLVIFKSLGYKSEITKVYHQIGLNYLDLSDFPQASNYILKSLKIDEELDDKLGMVSNYRLLGNIYFYQNDPLTSIDYTKRALKLNREVGHKYYEASCLESLSLAYRSLSDDQNAIHYIEKAIVIYKELGEINSLGNIYNNLGVVYYHQADYEKAHFYFQKAKELNQQMGAKLPLARIIFNIGLIYRDAPDSLLSELGVLPEERFSRALVKQIKAYEITKELNAVRDQMVALSFMSGTYEMQGDYKKALQTFKTYLTLRDSINSEEIRNQINRKTLQFEYEQKETKLLYEQQLTEEKLLRSTQELGLREQELQLSIRDREVQNLAYLNEKAKKQERESQLALIEAEKQLQSTELLAITNEKQLQNIELQLSIAELNQKNQQRNGFIAISVLLFLMIGGLYTRSRSIRKSRDLIAKEKDRSDNLLLNILPFEIAEELKEKGRADARDYDQVNILFTDFKDFTEQSAKLSAKELVGEINHCFETFDGIIEKFGIEKIKTIGDAYMAAGGLPVPTDDSVKKTVLAALEMQAFITGRKNKNQGEGKPAFEMRLGIHTGPVVAGIVGVKKFQYDIWGDTVNTAARMESKSEVGKVNISQATYEMLKNDPDFIFESRGKIEAKGKGQIEMYFVQLKKENEK